MATAPQATESVGGTRRMGRPSGTAHIRLDERGVAWVDDTNTKVAEIVLDWLAYGSDLIGIHEQHPHLSLAQIHAAFSYYYDHQEEVDALIERRDRGYEEARPPAGESPFVKRMRAGGKLRQRGG